MTQTLRWGLLSTARITRHLIQPLRNSRRNELAAVASRTKEKADAFARENKIKSAYDSYEALLADPDIDVIYNPLPNNLHAEWTIKAVEAGKHVLCEKPMALSLDEVDAISAAAEKHGKAVVEALAYRSHPQMLKIREIVDDGKLGRVRMVRGTYTYTLTNPENIRLKPEMGGGSLWDVGCYPLSFTCAVLGAKPLEVFGWQVKGATGIDETFAAQIHFPGDICAELDCSFKIPYRVFMEIIGEEGTLSIPQPFNTGAIKTLYLTREGKTSEMVVKGLDPYAGEVETMADTILLGKPPAVSLAESRASIAAIVALFRSANTGKSILL